MIRHTVKISLGILLVIIGLIGGLIPIFQGWMFGVPGLDYSGKLLSSRKTIIRLGKVESGVYAGALITIIYNFHYIPNQFFINRSQ